MHSVKQLKTGRLHKFSGCVEASLWALGIRELSGALRNRKTKVKWKLEDSGYGKAHSPVSVLSLEKEGRKLENTHCI